MTLRMQTSADRWVELEPLDLGVVHDAEPGPSLVSQECSGDAFAARLLTSAAQRFFEFPVGDAKTGFHVDGRAIGYKAMSNLVSRRKMRITAFRDPASGAIQLLYRELVVRFREGTRPNDARSLLGTFGLTVRRCRHDGAPRYVVRPIDSSIFGEALVELCDRLAGHASVDYATPNFVAQYNRCLSNPPFSASDKQWHLQTIGAKEAWDLVDTTVGSIRIAIIDDGVEFDHDDLVGNIVFNPDPDEPRDRFGRDFHVPTDRAGHFDPTPKIFAGDPSDTATNDIHGTACAGVAAGRSDAMASSAPYAGVLPVKVFHASHLTSPENIAAAIDYAARLADVLSISWTGPFSPEVARALDRAATTDRDPMPGRPARPKRPIIVCATGNDHRTDAIGFPASSAHCIAVGACTDADQRPDYANAGPGLWVVAPSDGGTKAVFTTDVSQTGLGYNTAGQLTDRFGGTSAACAMVAGLVALMLAKDASLTLEEIRTILAATALQLDPTLAGTVGQRSNEFGYGRIQAGKALQKVAGGRPFTF